MDKTTHPSIPYKENVMNIIFISSKSHPNLMVTKFLLILINSKGLMVNTVFLIVRLMHKFSVHCFHKVKKFLSKVDMIAQA